MILLIFIIDLISSNVLNILMIKQKGMEPITDATNLNQEGRKYILRKLKKVQKVSEKLHEKAKSKHLAELSNANDAALIENLKCKYQRQIHEINRIKCKDEIPLFEALFVEDLILGVQRIQQQLNDFLEIYVKKTDSIPDGQLHQFCSEMLWHFWDDALTQIEKENQQILNTIKLSNCAPLLNKFTNELAKFRVMGKLYSAQIAKELEACKLKSCIMSMVIALEGMADQMALKHNLCSNLMVCREKGNSASMVQLMEYTMAVNKPGHRRGHNGNSVANKRGKDILAALYWHRLYEESPVVYDAMMIDAFKDDNRMKSVLHGEKCVKTMPATIYKKLMHKTKSIMNTNPDCIHENTFIRHWFTNGKASHNFKHSA